MRALTKLNQVGIAGRTPDGKPPEMPLKKIIRDPDNPRPPLHMRTPEERQIQAELNANVKSRGVKSPISLRPHPTLPEVWIINHGHCRFDAAEAAGLATIPYFVDPNFDSYDQVAENLHRCDLSIWAIAAFIKRKLDEGQSKSEIAERLGKESPNYVTEHLALVDAPACVYQAYASGIKSPRTLYDLRRAYDEFPEKVEEWCDGGKKITRDTIKELLDGLRRWISSAFSHDGVGNHQETPSPPARPTNDMTADQESARHTVPEVTDSRPLRHDVATLTEAEGQAGKSGLRNDASPTTLTVQQPGEPKLRHDINASLLPDKLASSTGSHVTTAIATEILVSYQGTRARIVSCTRVKIVIDGHVEQLDVSVDDLEFIGAKTL